MATIGTASVVKLSDSQSTVKDPLEDVRGRKVLDKEGKRDRRGDHLCVGLCCPIPGSRRPLSGGRSMANAPTWPLGDPGVQVAGHAAHQRDT